MVDMMVNEKRKNDDPRRFPWRVLVAGIVIGAVFGILLMSRSSGSGVVVYTSADDPMLLTATAIIERATDAVQGTPMPLIQPESQTGVDPIQATATVLILQATQQAAAPET